MNFTPEMLEKAKTATSAAELFSMSKENGIDLTAEEALTYYLHLHAETGKISDEELDNVAGGCGTDYFPGTHPCPVCGQMSTGVRHGMWPVPVDCCMNPNCPRYGDPVDSDYMDLD